MIDSNQNNNLDNNDLDKTKSLYNTEEHSNQTQNQDTKQPDIKQLLNTVNNTGNKKPKNKGEVGLLIGIGVIILILIGAFFIFVGSKKHEDTPTTADTKKSSSKKANKSKKFVEDETSGEYESVTEEGKKLSPIITQRPQIIRNRIARVVDGEENQTKVDKAVEIRDDQNLFIIEPDLYGGLCIEHTTTFSTEDGSIEIRGIYLGSTENGKPEGYGAFYYRQEGGNKEERGGVEAVMDIIYAGDWHEGNLIIGQDITRKTSYVGESSQSIYKIKYILEGKWADTQGMGFSDNPNGTYIREVTDIETGEILNGQSGIFYGVFEENNITPMSGEEYELNGTLIYRGDYKDGEYYNGMIYDEEGDIKAVVRDGVTYDSDSNTN